MFLFTIFTFFLTLVSVSASVISTPTVHSPSPDPLPFAQLGARKAQTVNDCDIGFYTETTDANSPLIEDCEALSHNLYEGTDYLILNNGFYQVAQYKSCAVGLVSWDCENNNSISCLLNLYTAKIGDEDIGSLLRNAIILAKYDARPGGAGRVGAWGMFECQIELVKDMTGAVKWYIFPNPYKEDDPWHPWMTGVPKPE